MNSACRCLKTFSLRSLLLKFFIQSKQINRSLCLHFSIQGSAAVLLLFIFITVTVIVFRYCKIENNLKIPVNTVLKKKGNEIK